MRIFVLLPLLIVVSMSFSIAQDAKSELRTWTAVNGKEVDAEFVSNEKGIVKLKLKSGKVFEVPIAKLSMEDNEFISSLDKPDGVNWAELEFREPNVYLKGSDTPYTGKVFRLNENGKKSSEGTLKDGKMDGLSTSWHKNGQKKWEDTWKDGKRDGLLTIWQENGQKEREEIWKDGKRDGLSTRWHENGQKAWELNWKDGDLVEGFAKFWNRKGEPVDSAEEAGIKP